MRNLLDISSGGVGTPRILKETGDGGFVNTAEDGFSGVLRWFGVGFGGLRA